MILNPFLAAEDKVKFPVEDSEHKRRIFNPKKLHENRQNLYVSLTIQIIRNICNCKKKVDPEPKKLQQELSKSLSLLRNITIMKQRTFSVSVCHEV